MLAVQTTRPKTNSLTNHNVDDHDIIAINSNTFLKIYKTSQIIHNKHDIFVIINKCCCESLQRIQYKDKRNTRLYIIYQRHLGNKIAWTASKTFKLHLLHTHHDAQCSYINERVLNINVQNTSRYHVQPIITSKSKIRLAVHRLCPNEHFRWKLLNWWYEYNHICLVICLKTKTIL